MQIKNLSFVAISLIGLTMLFYGCSPNSTNPLTPLKSGEMTATISGLGSFYASNAVVKLNTVYDVRASIVDQNKNDSLVIEMFVTQQSTTPYTIDVTQDDNSAITFCALQPDGSCKNYSASKLTPGTSGQIKITSISPNLEGTFSGTLQQIGGSGSVTISGGEFNASF